jgi:ketol-acid reductoisomerase
MKIYYEKEADLALIKSQRVTIIGYGSQGHAHALNLKDSGVEITVGLRRDSASWQKAQATGLNVQEIAQSVQSADIVMILSPDEQIAEVYRCEVASYLKKGAALGFAHGFNVHY